METLRKYGTPPYTVAVIHGGPGAAGEVTPVAEELSKLRGILEPLQTASSVNGQVEELRGTLENNASPPVTIIGYSWGAWLAFIFASRHPELVKKLILVSSGPFRDKYVPEMTRTRLGRLTDPEKAKLDSLTKALNDPRTKDRETLFAQFGKLMSKTDSFSPQNTQEKTQISFREDIYKSIWPEAAELRRTGKLLAMAHSINCPVIAIHGDYDPHPAEGVREPLSKNIQGFRFILLEKCGHKPWMETHAKESFYEILRRELSRLTP